MSHFFPCDCYECEVCFCLKNIFVSNLSNLMLSYERRPTYCPCDLSYVSISLFLSLFRTAGSICRKLGPLRPKARRKFHWEPWLAIFGDAMSGCSSFLEARISPLPYARSPQRMHWDGCFPSRHTAFLL